MKRWIVLLLMLLLLTPFAKGEEEDWSMNDLLPEEETEEAQAAMEAEAISAAQEAKKNAREDDGSAIITITAAGDFTIGGDSRKRVNIFEDEVKRHKGDINFTMRNIRDILMDDDMTIVNFEGTLTESTYVPPEKKQNQFLFSAPPSYVSILADNSIEAVALENNHIMDHGQEVYDETMSTLANAGIIYSNSSTIGVYEVKGVKIAMLSYLCIDRYDSLFKKVPEDIAKAKAEYPIVIVSFHWGRELDYFPTENQIKMGRLAVDSGASLVLGHHSHRIQPIEKYNGVYICYSLGNFCFSGNGKPSDMSSFLFQIRFREKDGEVSDMGFRIIPIRISSLTERNDFTPTVLTKATAIDSILTTLMDNGKKLDYHVPEYPLNWE